MISGPVKSLEGAPVARREAPLPLDPRDYLVSLGYGVVQRFDGHAALNCLDAEPVDLVVLDLMLPGLDGLGVVRRLRAAGDLPIIMLTARDAEADKLLGLEVGADDYMTKPFGVRELEARIRAILRRSRRPSGAGGVLEHGGVQLDVDKHLVRKDGRNVRLTSAQFELLRILINEPGRVFSRRALVEAVSGSVYEGYERTVDVQVKNIRKSLEDDPARPSLILTVWGVGYKFRE